MPQHTAEEWIVAGAAVVAFAIAGAIAGARLASSPWLGLGVGVGAGLAFNWSTGCEVCRDHAAAMARSAGVSK